MSTRIRAVAFDFGGPVLLTPFELLRAAERRLGLAAGRLDWHGPFDPQADPLWQQLLRAEITEREYWHRRAAEFAQVARVAGAGAGDDPQDLFGFLYDLDPAELIRPQALEFLDVIRSAGLRAAVLTNDLGRFHPPEWIAAVPFLKLMDVIVDGSVTGILKPDPRAYRLLLTTLELPAEQVLFIDDQPHNARGAAEVGMAVVHFDVTDPAASYRAAAALLQPAHLPPS